VNLPRCHMSEEAMIKTFCTKCGMVYDLDSSLIGQFGECAGCGAAFEITDQTDYVNQMLASQEAEAPAAPAEASAPEAPAEQPAPAAPAEAPAPEAPAEQPVPAAPAEAPAPEAPAEQPAPAAPAAPAFAAPPAAPAAPAAPAPAPAVQEGDVVMNREEDESAPTNTVKLSRVSRAGMLPEIKDNPFKVGTINVGTQTVIGSTQGSRRFSDKKFTFSRASSASAAPARKKHWWEFWKK